MLILERDARERRTTECIISVCVDYLDIFKYVTKRIPA